ncbi:hypothetical protein B6S59_05160 [Pseudomonas sp. A46]|nr:hypothetical protein [Pseudomonas sp. A46]OWJ96844.1 hypothetical protein B6S59_05160 [Pseudomonas sp. A46]
MRVPPVVSRGLMMGQPVLAMPALSAVWVACNPFHGVVKGGHKLIDHLRTDEANQLQYDKPAHQVIMQAH